MSICRFRQLYALLKGLEKNKKKNRLLEIGKRFESSLLFVVVEIIRRLVPILPVGCCCTDN